MIWNKVSAVGVVEGIRVLGLWADGHIEDVEFEVEDGQIYHYTHEGECLGENPVYWVHLMELPEGFDE